MRPLRVEMEGFLSYRDRVEIDLVDVGAAAILGPNGAGKTSIIEAISWALYGEGRGRGPDEMVHPEATRASVKLVLKIGERAYAVQRERTVGKTPRSSLSFVSYDLLGVHETGEEEFGWRDIGHPNIVDTQAAIVDLLGMSFATWEATSYIGQGRADAFTKLRPAERKKLLGEVLELDRYVALAGICRERMSELKARAEELRRQINALEDVVRDKERVGLEIERTQGRLDEASELLASRREAAERASAAAIRAEEAVSRSREGIRRRGAVQGRLRGLQAEVDRLTLERLDLEPLTQTLPARQAELEALTARLEDLRVDVEAALTEKETAGRHLPALEEKLAGARTRLGELKAARETLAGLSDVCPTCLQEIEPATHDRLLAEAIEREAEVAYAAEVELPQKIARSRQAWAELKERAEHFLGLQDETARDLRDVADQVRAAIEAGERLEAGAQTLEAMTSTIEELNREVDELEELPDIEAAEVAAGEARSDALAAQNLLGRSESDIRDLERLLGGLQAQMRAIEVATSDLQAREVDRIGLERDYRVTQTLERAFGRDGIPALLIETAIPEIESEANELLGLLTGGRLQVSLETLGAKKTGGMRETLEIVVGDDVSERPLESLSGGERQMVDLALRIGLARLLAGRVGRPIETLVIDEGFTELDAGHRQRTVEAFAGLRSVFPMMLVVTHLEDLAEAFGTRFLVERAGGTSTVKREG